MRSILATLLLVLISTTVEAKPRKARVAVHPIMCDDRGCNDRGAFGVVQRRTGRAARTVERSVRRFAVATSGTVSAAARHMGATARQLGLPARLWCADFANMVLRSQGYRGTGSRAARSFLALPRTAPRVGAIAVMSRGKRGGHVGFVAGFDSRGNPIIVSGNHGRKVGEGTYPASRVIAYVSPV